MFCVSQVSKTHKLKLQMWDTAGQERFASMASLYYRGADAAILVFDCTVAKSLQSVKNWVKGRCCINQLSLHSFMMIIMIMVITYRVTRTCGCLGRYCIDISSK